MGKSQSADRRQSLCYFTALTLQQKGLQSSSSVPLIQTQEDQCYYLLKTERQNVLISISKHYALEKFYLLGIITTKQQNKSKLGTKAS